MAGDWIKVEENMPDKPEVCRMAARLGIECDAVAGKLVRVWVWAGRNCNADGNTSVTVRALLDRLTGVTGFCEAMTDAGWLVVSGDTMTFPKFDRHCSQSAKARADTQRRVSKHRAIGNAENVTTVTDEALPKRYQRREEKRREETIQTEVATVVAPAAKVPLQTDAEWLQSMTADPTYAGVDVMTEHGKMVRWCETNRQKPSRRRFVNWLNRCEKPMVGTTHTDQPQRRMSFA
jgi:hypothetical protein